MSRCLLLALAGLLGAACSYPNERPLDIDSPALTVTQAVPADGASGIATDVVVELHFDADLAAPVLGGSVRMSAGPVDVPVNVAVDGSVMRIVPVRYEEAPPRRLETETTYTIVLNPQIRSAAGGNLKTTFLMKFRTGT